MQDGPNDCIEKDLGVTKDPGVSKMLGLLGYINPPFVLMFPYSVLHIRLGYFGPAVDVILAWDV